MIAADLVSTLRRRGVLLVPEPDGRILYRPTDALTGDERDLVARHRRAIVELLEDDPVAWRAAVMATQVTPTGTIPLLIARPGRRGRPGACCSCGDPVPPTRRFRCDPCVEAAVAVIAMARS